MRARPFDAGQLIRDERWLISPSRGAGLSVGLVYPSSYYVGMSNLGYQIILRLLAQRQDVCVERIFYSDTDIPPRSIESGRAASEFDVLAFSCCYELDYLNLIRFLIQAGIEPLSEVRGGNGPLLLGGGVAVTANPAPLSCVLDAVLLGDGEALTEEVLDQVVVTSARTNDIPSILESIDEVPGGFVPSVEHMSEANSRREKNLDPLPTGSAILTPHTDLANMYLVEIARGCARGCKFCLTGHHDRRLLRRSLDTLIGNIDSVKEKIERVGLIASEAASHTDIITLCKWIVDQGLGVSTSSLEMDRVKPELLELLVQGGQKTLTIAPESGSESVRFAMGKRAADAQILETARRAGEAGIEVLKLYFLIGTPLEETGEVESTVALLRDIRAQFFAAGGRKRKELSVSVNPFVPKPHTPWANEKMASTADLKKGMQEIRKAAGRMGGVKLGGLASWVASLESSLSLGSAESGKRLVQMIKENKTAKQISREMIER